jgi:hypothetical protein
MHLPDKSCVDRRINSFDLPGPLRRQEATGPADPATSGRRFYPHFLAKAPENHRAQDALVGFSHYE